MEKGLFYCLNCGELIAFREAAMVFRTGFYKAKYPLGCCEACEAKQAVTCTQENRGNGGTGGEQR